MRVKGQRRLNATGRVSITDLIRKNPRDPGHPRGILRDYCGYLVWRLQWRALGIFLLPYSCLRFELLLLQHHSRTISSLLRHRGGQCDRKMADRNMRIGNLQSDAGRVSMEDLDAVSRWAARIIKLVSRYDISRAWAILGELALNPFPGAPAQVLPPKAHTSTEA